MCGFLSRDYDELIFDLITNFSIMGRRMHMLHSQLDNFKNNMGAYSREQTEGFHQNIMGFERLWPRSEYKKLLLSIEKSITRFQLFEKTFPFIDFGGNWMLTKWYVMRKNYKTVSRSSSSYEKKFRPHIWRDFSRSIYEPIMQSIKQKHILFFLPTLMYIYRRLTNYATKTNRNKFSSAWESI